MTSKRRLHHVWKRLRHIKPWYFLALAIISGLICIVALRSNNETMVSLRQAVYAADQHDTGTQAALTKLQAYVTAHMNTNLSSGNTSVYPPIQLKYTYDRLVLAQGQAVSDANGKIYTDAQHYCEQQNSTDISGHNRVPCIEQYVQSHTAKTAAAIPDALYKFDFVSPSWSPDLAGWTLFASVIFAALFVVTFVVGRWFKREVN